MPSVFQRTFFDLNEEEDDEDEDEDEDDDDQDLTMQLPIDYSSAINPKKKKE